MFWLERMYSIFSKDCIISIKEIESSTDEKAWRLKGMATLTRVEMNDQ